MKKNVTLSLDYEAYLEAKAQLGNVSEYVSECLQSFNNQDEETDNYDAELKELDKTLTDAHIRKSVILNAIKTREENKAKKAQEMQDNEQYTRWKCPVCKQLNFMEFDRCGKCTLPTKNDPKTEIVNTKEMKQ